MCCKSLWSLIEDELPADGIVLDRVISRYLNTMSGHAICSVGFVAVGAIVSFICSLPRTFKTLSKLATVSTIFTFISVIFATIFAGIEDHPAGFNPDPNHVNEDGGKMGGNPLVLIFPMVGTTFVSGMNAYLNIGYTFMGQLTLPSFIAEMENPYDFRKALWIVTGAETVVFSLVGAGRKDPLATDPG
jgi:Transmembrane amino acid transporter protein